MKKLIGLLESFQRGFPRATYKQVRSKSEEMEVAKSAPIYQNTQYEGWRIEATIHAAAQSYDRRPDFEFSTWKEIHRRMVRHLNTTFPKRSGEYLFYSKSYEQGYVVNVDFGKRLIKIITVLPKGKNRPQDRTQLVIVEGVMLKIIEFIDID